MAVTAVTEEAPPPPSSIASGIAANVPAKRHSAARPATAVMTIQNMLLRGDTTDKLALARMLRTQRLPCTPSAPLVCFARVMPVLQEELQEEPQEEPQRGDLSLHGEPQEGKERRARSQYRTHVRAIDGPRCRRTCTSLPFAC